MSQAMSGIGVNAAAYMKILEGWVIISISPWFATTQSIRFRNMGTGCRILCVLYMHTISFVIGVASRGELGGKSDEGTQCPVLVGPLAY